MSIRVLLADDHNIFRTGMRALLESQPDIAVVGEAENGRETVLLAKKLAPSVILMDVSMPDLNGIEAARQIVTEMPSVKVIGLSMHSEKRLVVGMLDAGASGYLLKNCTLQELILSIRVAEKGKIYLSPDVASMVVRNYLHRSPTEDFSVYSILTPRECEVLQLVAEGKTSKQIASCLNIGVNTVETHRKQIMEKLNIHTVAELTKYAVREGLTPP